MASQAQFPLSRELMENQLSTIDLLEAMFPSEGEVEMSDSTRNHRKQLQAWCESSEVEPPSNLPTTLSLIVRLELEGSTDTIQVNVTVPVRTEREGNEEVAPRWSYTIRQPPYMSKSQVADLTASIPTSDSSDILEVFDYIRTQTPLYLLTSQSAPPDMTKDDTPLVRVWFYFPSLSTRSKRADIVNHAPTYHLTGFVQAGKPGLLCLEGKSRDIDGYMKFIKSVSWGDIPSYQKKVSERYREEGPSVRRVFRDMTEVTDVDSMGGRRGNRTDMQVLEAWLKDLGLGEAFEKVIF